MSNLSISTESCDRGWSESELGSVDLGDKRLNKRLLSVAETLSSMPLSPINQASQDWAAAKAAYRLFSNEKVTPESLLSVHRENTVRRALKEEVILAIQDTTYLNYSNHHSCSGLGYIQEGLKGVVIHNTLAITPEGLPLGLLGQAKSSRQSPKKKEHYTKRSTKERESYRWIEALEETSRLTKDVKKVVTVCDREADIYDFLQAAEAQDALYLIRAHHKRALADISQTNLFESMRQKPPAGKIEINIPSRAGKKAHTVEAAVSFDTLRISPPKAIVKQARLESIKLYAVMVQEIQNEPDQDSLQWLLITNDPVLCLEDAIEKIKWYKARWQIEIYHKIFKSGCKVEDCRLETIDRLYVYLALFGIIAWRIYWLTHINRTHPKADVSLVLSKIEQEALSLLSSQRDKKKTQIKTVRQAIIAIAKLGGFLARRHDGHPGPTVIWRGWQRLADGTIMVEAIARQGCG